MTIYKNYFVKFYVKINYINYGDYIKKGAKNQNNFEVKIPILLITKTIFSFGNISLCKNISLPKIFLFKKFHLTSR